MALNWLECLIYGILSGFSEFFPVSSLAHQAVYLKLLGKENDPVLQCCAHIGALAAVLIFCLPILNRLHKERRIAALPKKRRRRQPDLAALMESRVLRMAAVSMLVLFIGYGLVADLYQRLWILAIFLGVNGIVLYVPQYLPGANKTAQSLSALDAMLIGIAGGCGMIPGISRIGAAVSTGLIRGVDRRYALELALLISVPALLALVLLTGLAAMGGGASFSGGTLLRCITVTASAFGAAYFAIFLMRFLSVRVGFGGFAYYSWGLALFTLILYLI